MSLKNGSLKVDVKSTLHSVVIRIGEWGSNWSADV